MRRTHFIPMLLLLPAPAAAPALAQRSTHDRLEQSMFNAGSLRLTDNGDRLVASPTAGRAMRNGDPAPGTVLAKALEPLDSGSGTIRVLVRGR